jgi:NitT/TauT family transport system permease protein
MATSDTPVLERTVLALKKNLGERTRARLNFVSLGLVFLGWVMLSNVYPETLFPSPSRTLLAACSLANTGALAAALKTTLFHILAGYLICMAVGISLGILMGRIRPVEEFNKDLISFAQTIPSLIIIAFSVIFFGISHLGVIFTLVVVGLPFIVVTVWEGAKNVDANLIEMGRVYHSGRKQILNKIVMPSVVPEIFAGSRLLIGALWRTTLFAEFIMGKEGLGARIQKSMYLMETPEVFAWGGVVVALMVVSEHLVFRPLEVKTMNWKKKVM